VIEEAAWKCLQRRYEAKPMSRMPKCSGVQLNIGLIVPAALSITGL
jgi:hypothetical protein